MHRLNLFTTLFILIICGIFITPDIFAQSESNNIIVRGTIVDDQGLKLPFARVKITPYGIDSTQYYTQVSDHLGAFRIGVPVEDKYKIEVSLVGMEDLVKEFDVPEGQNEYDLGDLELLESATILEGVTVTASKKLITAEVDKISYEMKDDPESKNSSLLKMLRKVPLVTVDAQGNIQVNGSSNFQIYRNGRLDRTLSSSPKDVLKSIPASTIKKIEVITDPGVRFDAESTGAILNIITDRNTSLVGVAGSVFTDIGSYGNVNGGLYLNAKAGKFGLTGNVMHGRFGGRPSIMEVETLIGNTQLFRSGESDNNGTYNIFNGVLSYEIDSLNLLSLSTKGLPYKSDSKHSQIEERSINGVIMEKNRDLTNSSNQRGSYSINLDFQHSTNTPGELLTLSYMFDRTPDSSESRQIREKLDIATGDPLPSGFGEQLTKSRSAMNEHTTQIDYTRPIEWKKKHTIEAGIKFIARRSESTPEYLLRNSPDEEFTIGSLFGQHKNNSPLNYAQNIYALYLGWTSKWSSKFSTKLGTRLEQSNLDVKYTTLPDADFKREQFDFVPQVRLSYNITPFDQTSVNYNFKIQRPGISQVNPYRKQTSQHWINYGNPDLEAQKNHNLSLTYGHFGSKLTLNTTLGFNFSNNVILSYSKEAEETPGVIHQTYGNLGENRGLSFNAYVNYTPWTWLRLYLNGNVSTNTLKSNVMEEMQKWNAFFAFGGGYVTLPKSWNTGFSLGGYKFGRYQMTNEFSYFFSVSVGKSFFNDKLSLSLYLNQPFQNEMTYKMHAYGKGFETHTTSTDLGARTISVNVRYNFGQLKERIKSVSRTISNTDLMKGENDEGGGKRSM